MKSRGYVLGFLVLLLSPGIALAQSSASLEPTTPLLQAIEEAAQVAALGGLGIPAPSWRACVASQTCPNGCQISCTGPTDTDCSSTATTVTCNGVTTSCPYPGCTPPSPDCVDPCGYCKCRVETGAPCYRYCQ